MLMMMKEVTKVWIFLLYFTFIVFWLELLYLYESFVLLQTIFLVSFVRYDWLQVSLYVLLPVKIGVICRKMR